MSKSDDPTWPEYLKAAMDAANIASASDLSRQAGISEPMVSRWLRGMNQPDIENLRKLAPVLRVPLLALVVAAGHLSANEARIRELPTPQRPRVTVPEAIRQDDELLPEAQDHLERQYGLLRRLGPGEGGAGGSKRPRDPAAPPSPAVPLRRVARKRTPPKRPT